MTPKMIMYQMSIMLLWTANAPMAQMTTMNGVRIANGKRRMAAKNGTNASTMSTPMMLPVYMLAIRPQTKSGCSLKSIGPGCRPQMIRPPNMTAAVGDPGIPSVIIGSMAATPAACAAVSGATTPSISPLPKRSGCLEARLANAYAMNDAGVAPPGLNPIQKPMMQLRRNVRQYRPMVFQVSKTTFKFILVRAPSNLSPSSTLTRISPIPKSPITATMKSNPDISGVSPNVILSCPVTMSSPTAARMRPTTMEMNDLTGAPPPSPTKLENVRAWMAKNSGGPKCSATSA